MCIDLRVEANLIRLLLLQWKSRSGFIGAAFCFVASGWNAGALPPPNINDLT
jgi:hypothetical protein